MARPFANLAEDMLRLSGTLAGNANNAVRGISAAIHEECVLATPVDTGKARSNWVVTLGTPFIGELNPYSPGSHLGIGERANAEAAIQQGRNILGARQPSEGEAPVFITNNVDYLDKIRSPQIAFQPMSSVIETAILSGISRVSIKLV